MGKALIHTRIRHRVNPSVLTVGNLGAETVLREDLERRKGKFDPDKSMRGELGQINNLYAVVILEHLLSHGQIDGNILQDQLEKADPIHFDSTGFTLQFFRITGLIDGYNSAKSNEAQALPDAHATILDL